MSVVAPRPRPEDLDEFYGKGHYGKVYMQFDTIDAADKARKGIDGRIFDGRTVVAKYVDVVAFGEATEVGGGRPVGA